MRFNIFEGARRISLAVAVLATAGTLIGLFTHEPYASLSYSVAHPTGPFVRTEDSCPYQGARHYFSTHTTKGRRASINLCLLPMQFGEKREELIPYKVDDKGMIWGAATYSTEVSSYERSLETRFRLSVADDQEISREISREYRDNWFTGLGILAVCLAVFAAFVWTTGWVVRGFLGIPRGKDARLSESPSQ